MNEPGLLRILLFIERLYPSEKKMPFLIFSLSLLPLYYLTFTVSLLSFFFPFIFFYNLKSLVSPFSPPPTLPQSSCCSANRFSGSVTSF